MGPWRLLEGALDRVQLVRGQPAAWQGQVGAGGDGAVAAHRLVGHGDQHGGLALAGAGPVLVTVATVPGRAPAAAHRWQPAGGEPPEDGPVDPVAGHPAGRGRRGQGEEVQLGDGEEVQEGDQAKADGGAVGDAELDPPPGQHGEGHAHAAAVADEPPDVAPVPLGVGVVEGEAADAGDGVAPEPGEHQADPQEIVDAGGDHAGQQADQGPLAPGRVADAEQDHDGEGRDDGVVEPVGQRHQPGQGHPQRGDGREPEDQVEDPREHRRVGQQHPDRGQQLGVLGGRPPGRAAERSGRRHRWSRGLGGLLGRPGLPWPLGLLRPLGLPGPLRTLGPPRPGGRLSDLQPGDGHVVRSFAGRGSWFASPSENPPGPSPIPTGSGAPPAGPPGQPTRTMS